MVTGHEVAWAQPLAASLAHRRVSPSVYIGGAEVRYLMATSVEEMPVAAGSWAGTPGVRATDLHDVTQLQGAHL